MNQPSGFTLLPRARTFALSLLAAQALSATLPALAAERSAPDLEAGRRTFESVCAACHGTTGRPDPENPVVKALKPQPADPSSPLFNSREPAEDWQIVVKHGGQALGLSATMPAQGAVLDEGQIRDVVAYAKTLAPGSDEYPPGELNFFLPIRTKKAFPEDEIVWKSRLTDRDGADVWRNVIEIEKRFGKRSMGVLEVIHEDDGTDSEITEVEVGAKTVLHWDLARRSILSGAVELADVMHYRWTHWPRRVFPALELTAAVPFDDEGGDPVQWTVIPQLRFGLTRGAHVALNLGAEFPLSDQSYDTRWHLTLLWDFADGSFFKGWR